MNQSRAFFVSLAFAFLGMGLVYFYISEKEDEAAKANGDLVKVVVATRPINEMQTIDADMIQESAVPSKFKQPNAATNINDIVGMVALVPIQENEQVVPTKLAPKGVETGIASQVAASKRAMSIPVDNKTGVTKLLKPGDHVDILSKLSYGGGENGKQVELKTILQNINILAVGEMIMNNIPQIFVNDPLTQKKIPESARLDRNFETVTVEVTPEQAQVLVYSLEEASSLYLTLRNPIDRVELPVGTTTLDEVLGPDSKRAEARDKEQKRLQEEARRQAAEQARLQALQNGKNPDAPARAPAKADPLESGGGVLE